jgi:hypothetical protein
MAVSRCKTVSGASPALLPRLLGCAMPTFAQVEGMRLLPVTSSVPFSTMPVRANLDSSGNVWFLAVNKKESDAGGSADAEATWRNTGRPSC